MVLGKFFFFLIVIIFEFAWTVLRLITSILQLDYLSIIVYSTGNLSIEIR